MERLSQHSTQCILLTSRVHSTGLGSLEFRIACLLVFLDTATLSLSLLASIRTLPLPSMFRCEISISNWPMRAAMWRPTHHTYARQISPFPRFFLLLFSTCVGALHGICPRILELRGRGERRTKESAFVSLWTELVLRPGSWRWRFGRAQRPFHVVPTLPFPCFALHLLSLGSHLLFVCLLHFQKGVLPCLYLHSFLCDGRDGWFCMQVSKQAYGIGGCTGGTEGERQAASMVIRGLTHCSHKNIFRVEWGTRRRSRGGW